TQAILVARLSGQYHDLTCYASESLRQRIHYLARPDGSNLKELFTWDLPPPSPLALPQPSWSVTQLDDYLQGQWSVDEQFPLNPPNFVRSWESIGIYYKALDSETVQAMVPIGRMKLGGEDVTWVVVLTQEVIPRDREEEEEEEYCWRYHNMTAIRETELGTSGWNVLCNHPMHAEASLMQESKTCTSQEADENKNNNIEKEKGNGDSDDADDDYWGQYGDAGDDSTAEENASGEDDEDAYWGKYAQHQEEQEQPERKRNLQQDSPITKDTLANEQQRLLTSLASPGPKTLPASLQAMSVSQMDPIMLSSLLQLLVTEEESIENLSSSSNQSVLAHNSLIHEESTPEKVEGALEGSSCSALTSSWPLPTGIPLSQGLASGNMHSCVDMGRMLPSSTVSSRDESSRPEILESLRSIVRQATLAGYSKDEVFEMLGNIYDPLE
ncbi:hypothetical protein BGZ65_006748, partial [Modicella reniformis]